MKTTLKTEKMPEKKKVPADWQKKVRDREPRPVYSSSEIAIGYMYVAGPPKKRAAQQNESNRVRSAIEHARKEKSSEIAVVNLRR